MFMWSKGKRLLAMLAILCAVMGGTVVVAPGPAQAAAGCSNCDDKDPSSFKYKNALCTTDATSVAKAIGGGDVVHLMYSNRCRTAWARSIYQVYFWIERYSPHRVEDTYPNTDGSWAWTAMVYDEGYVSRACFHQPYGNDICSTWY